MNASLLNDVVRFKPPSIIPAVPVLAFDGRQWKESPTPMFEKVKQYLGEKEKTPVKQHRNLVARYFVTTDNLSVVKHISDKLQRCEARYNEMQQAAKQQKTL